MHTGRKVPFTGKILIQNVIFASSTDEGYLSAWLCVHLNWVTKGPAESTG